MSRQDANAAFALSSFLYGGNAAYIEDLFARYEADPKSVDAEWQAFFGGMKDGADAAKSARGASWKRPPLIERNELHLRARRPMGRGREEDRRQGAGEGAGRRRRAFARRRAAGDARFGPRADADPRLSHPRPLPRQARSARARAAQGRRGTRSALLRLHRGRLRPQDLPRQGARARIRHAARDRRDPAAHLLPDARRRVHAHLQCRPEGLDPGAHRGARQGDQLHARRQARDPQQAGRGRRFREVLRHQVHRHQALRARRRRVADPGAGADHQARRQSRREGDRARHAASRPAERADPGDGQAAPRAVPRVQGRLGRARRRRRLGRREVSPRRLVGPRVRRQQGAPVAHREPVASRDRQSGGARQGARQAGPARRDAGRPHHGAAAADARRRGVRRARAWSRNASGSPG